MSKIYEALQRVGSERAEHQAREQRMRERVSSGARDWWKGAVVGCAVGLGLALVAIPALPDRLAPLPPPEAGAVPVAMTQSPPSPPEPPATAAVVDAVPLTEPEPVVTVPAPGPLAIQVGTFRNRENAARLAARLKAEGYQVTMEPSRSDDTLWVVRVGDYPDRDPAELARAGLMRQGVSGVIVTREFKRDVEGAGRHARASGRDNHQP